MWKKNTEFTVKICFLCFKTVKRLEIKIDIFMDFDNADYENVLWNKKIHPFKRNLLKYHVLLLIKVNYLLVLRYLFTFCIKKQRI